MDKILGRSDFGVMVGRIDGSPLTVPYAVQAVVEHDAALRVLVQELARSLKIQAHELRVDGVACCVCGTLADHVDTVEHGELCSIAKLLERAREVANG